MLHPVTKQKEQAKILINTAEELFAKYGYDATSLRMITLKANMNLASVNYYFKSKEALYSEIFNNRLKMLNTKLSDISERELDDISKLDAYFDLYIENVAQNKNFHKMLSSEINLINHGFLKKELIIYSLHSHFDSLKKIVTAGISNGVFKNINIDIFTFSFFTLVLPLIDKLPIVEQICPDREIPHDIIELKEKIKKHFFSTLQK